MALSVEYAVGDDWREMSLPGTLRTAQRHAQRQAAYLQGTARVRDRTDDTVIAVHTWDAATHRVTMTPLAEAALTRPQKRILAEARAAGPTGRAYTGRMFAAIRTLNHARLVTYDHDLARQRITVRAAQPAPTGGNP